MVYITSARFSMACRSLHIPPHLPLASELPHAEQQMTHEKPVSVTASLSLPLLYKPE